MMWLDIVAAVALYSLALAVQFFIFVRPIGRRRSSVSMAM